MAARLREIEHQIAELRAEADRIAHGYDPTAAAAELAASRDYARSVREHGVEETVRGCAAALAKYGFCVVEHCIPEEDVPRVRDEVVEATHGAPRDPDTCFALRLPQLCEYLGCPAVAGTARATLDEHIRIAQINTRAVAADDPDPNIEWNRGNEWSGGHSPRGTGWREWHTCARHPLPPSCRQLRLLSRGTRVQRLAAHGARRPARQGRAGTEPLRLHPQANRRGLPGPAHVSELRVVLDTRRRGLWRDVSGGPEPLRSR